MVGPEDSFRAATGLVEEVIALALILAFFTSLITNAMRLLLKMKIVFKVT